MFLILWMSLVAYAIALSWLAWRRFFLIMNVPGTLLGWGGFIALMVATLASVLHESAHQAEVIGKVLVTMPAAFILAPFAARAIEVWVDAIRRSALSLDNIKPVRTYDLAEKAEREERFDEAFRLYRDVYGARNAADPVPHVRMADLHVRAGRLAEAVQELRLAATLFEDPQNALMAAFRAADFMSEPAEYLRSMRPRFPEPKWKSLLDARIAESDNS